MSDTPALSPLTNRRDLGGIRVADGVLRPGVFWRADDVALVDQATADQLTREGLSLVLDLRSADELEATGRGPLGDRPEIAFAHLPMTDAMAAPDENLKAAIAEMFAVDPTGAMGRWYAQTAEQQASKIVRGLGLICDTTGATVFHCAAGKDRTGIFAASILLSLGATRSAVVADYTRTNDNLVALHARLARGRGTTSKITGEDIPMAVKGAPAENIETMLDVLDQTHGGLVALLRDAGLTDTLLDRLRERAVLA